MGIVASSRVSTPDPGTIFPGGDGYVTTLEKFDYATETGSILTATLSAGKIGINSYNNPTVAGYAAAGITSGGYSTSIEKFDFNNETMSNISATLSQDGRLWSGQGSHAGAAGYSYGGYRNPNYLTSAEKLVFATESRASVGAGLSAGRSWVFSNTDDGTTIYVSGGETSFWLTFTTVDKFSYPTETRSTANLSNSQSQGSYFSNSGTAGYLYGGFIGDGSNGANSTGNGHKISFPSGSISTFAAGFDATYPDCTSNVGVAGYTVGGYGTRAITKFNFSTETRNALAQQAANTAPGFRGNLANSTGN